MVPYGDCNILEVAENVFAKWNSNYNPKTNTDFKHDLILTLYVTIASGAKANIITY